MALDPSNDIVQFVAVIRADRERMDDYRALVVSRMEDTGYNWWDNEFPMVFYRKGDKTRVDNATWRGSLPRAQRPTAGEDLEQWWRNRAKDFLYYPFYITQGSLEYQVEIQPDDSEAGNTHLSVRSNKKSERAYAEPGERFPPYYSRSPEYVCRPPLGVPHEDLDPIIETNPGHGPPGTILLRVARSAGPRPKSASEDLLKNMARQPDTHHTWLDPKRDYIAMRWDILEGANPGQEDIVCSTVVEEVKQSPRGIWYATQFRRKAFPPVQHDQVFNVYPDFDVELPDSLFTPPKVGSVLF